MYKLLAFLKKKNKEKIRNEKNKAEKRNSAAHH